MNRRDLLKLGATLTALPTVAAPQVSRRAPVHDWQPAFFDLHQYDTITAFSDIVIPTTDTPGAKDTLVGRHLDNLLAASGDAFRNQFRDDLNALDRFSRQVTGSDFVQAAPDQQRQILERMMTSGVQSSFYNLKAWIARMYYATRAGFYELNKGGRVPASLGCDDA